MPSLYEYIATAAAVVLGEEGTHAHQSRVQATVDMNSAPTPLIQVFDATTNQLLSTSRVKRADITLYFGDKKEGQGDDAVIEAAAVARMDELKGRFLAALDTNPALEISNVRVTPFHDAYESKLTGVGVQFTLAMPANNYCEDRPAPPVTQAQAFGGFNSYVFANGSLLFLA